MTSTNITNVPVQPQNASPRKKGGASTSGDQGDFYQMIQDKYLGNDIGITAGSGKNADTISAVTSPVSGKNSDPFKVDTAKSEPTAVTTTAPPQKVNSKAAPQKAETTQAQGEDEVTDEEKAEAMAALSDFAQQAVDVITEILPVTEEDIAAAMEELDLVPSDLMDPANLTALVSELTGAEDGMAILTMEGGKELFDQIGALTQDVMSETGLDIQTLQDLETEITVAEPVAEAVVDISAESDMVPQQNVDLPEGYEVQAKVTEEVAEPVVETEEMAVVSDKADRTAISMTSRKDDEDLTADEQDVNLSAEDAPVRQSEIRPKENENQNQNNMNQGHSGNPSGETRTDISSEHTASFAETVQEAPVNETPQVSSYISVNTEDVIRQIVTAARTTITAEVKEVSMILNPENLGKMIMRVTEQEGQVSAKLFAQNEAVKEALEKQLTVLKEQLSSAGVRVTEVEVTVSTHEFEEALEQGQQMQQGGYEASEGSGQSQNDESERTASAGNRSIDLGAEDGVPEDMTEAEALEASMMRDAGNSVSYSA